mgnify:FL=1
MDDTKSMKYQPIPDSRAINDKLLNITIPSISLPNQTGNLLKLNRDDTFRLVFYFYSMTGHPKKKLPEGWSKIPGAEGCTLENSIFRDNYENLIELNALPIGISTQTIDEIRDMTDYLGIKYDVLSDFNLLCVKKLSLPTFSIGDKIFIKRISIIVENNIIKKVFYPIVSINKHIDEVLKWLKKN